MIIPLLFTLVTILFVVEYGYIAHDIELDRMVMKIGKHMFQRETCSFCGRATLHWQLTQVTADMQACPLCLHARQDTRKRVIALIEKLGYTIVVKPGNEFHCVQGVTSFTLTSFVIDPENGVTPEETIKLLDRLITGEDANSRESLHHHVLCNWCEFAILQRIVSEKREYRTIYDGIASDVIEECPQCGIVLGAESVKEVRIAPVAL